MPRMVKRDPIHRMAADFFFCNYIMTRSRTRQKWEKIYDAEIRAAKIFFCGLHLITR